MSDDELKALERAVAAGGGVDARLRHGRALARVGRRDEALDTLLPARESEDVRRELGRFPRARADLCELEGTPLLVADVAPIERAPRIVWSRDWDDELDPYDDGQAPGDPLRAFLTHPLVAVLHVRGSPVRVINAVSGEDRWEHAWGESIEPDSTELLVRIDATTAVIWDGTELTARDLWTGEELWRWEPEARLNGFAFDGSRLATWSGGDLTLSRLAGREPELLWPATIRGGAVGEAFFLPDRLLVRTDDRLLALDQESGATRWTLAGKRFLVDERGILRRGKPRDLTLHDLEGRRLWSFRQPAAGVTLLPDVVLAANDRSERPFPIDRESGEARAPWAASGAFVGCTRSVIYGTEPELVARSLDGAELWRAPNGATRGESFRRVSPLHRSALVLTSHGRIFRLE